MSQIVTVGLKEAPAMSQQEGESGVLQSPHMLRFEESCVRNEHVYLQDWGRDSNLSVVKLLEIGL